MSKPIVAPELAVIGSGAGRSASFSESITSAFFSPEYQAGKEFPDAMATLVAIPSMVVAAKKPERVESPEESQNLQFALFPAKPDAFASGNLWTHGVGPVRSTKQIDTSDAAGTTASAPVETKQTDRPQREDPVENAIAFSPNGEKVKIIALAVLAPDLPCRWREVR
jgi:hypothetical protein